MYLGCWFSRSFRCRAFSRPVEKPRARARKLRLFVEPLEDRTTPASFFWFDNLVEGPAAAGYLADTQLVAGPLDSMQRTYQDATVSGGNLDLESLASNQAVSQLAIVDASVPNYSQLVDDLLQRPSPEAGFAVLVLDSRSDGIDQIEHILSQFHDLDAIHIFSHGNAGAVAAWLGRFEQRDPSGICRPVARLVGGVEGQRRYSPLRLRCRVRRGGAALCRYAARASPARRGGQHRQDRRRRLGWELDTGIRRGAHRAIRAVLASGTSGLGRPARIEVVRPRRLHRRHGPGDADRRQRAQALWPGLRPGHQLQGAGELGDQPGQDHVSSRRRRPHSHRFHGHDHRRARRAMAAARSSSTRPSSRRRSSPPSTTGRPRAWSSTRWRPP